MKLRYIILTVIILNFNMNLFSQGQYTGYNLRKHSNHSAIPSTLPLSMGLVGILYIFNPIINFENQKFSAGITKEFSVGFGYFGEHRVAVEYTYNFKSSMRNSLRFSYKYDILLKSDLSPSNMLQGTSVISIGGGYFTDFEDHGYFPEITYGYSIRNDRFLFYPHIKMHHTFITKKDKSNITDISFGVILGIANPFMDLKIRNRH